MSALLLSFVALAEPMAADTACAGGQVVASLPEVGATGVPVDVVPVAVLSTGDCESSAWTARLIVADTSEEVASAAASEGAILLELHPTALLAPFTDYIVQASAEDGIGAVTEIGFATGDGSAAVLDGVPEIVEGGATWYEESRELALSADVQPAASADGASLLAIGDDGEVDVAGAEIVTGSGAHAVLGRTSTYRPADEVCLVARQRDHAGRWAESEPLCAEPEIVEAACGCDAGVGALGVMPILLAAMLARRRG